MENPIKNITETIIGECRNFKHTLKEILYAIVIVLLINTFLIQNYQIPTGSMIPIIMPGDRLFANRFVYGVKLPFTDGLLGYRLPKIKSPQRGDLVVFRAPPSASFGCESANPYYEPSPLVQFLKLPIMVFSITPFTWDPRFLLGDFIGEKLTGDEIERRVSAIWNGLLNMGKLEHKQCHHILSLFCRKTETKKRIQGVPRRVYEIVSYDVNNLECAPMEYIAADENIHKRLEL